MMYIWPPKTGLLVMRYMGQDRSDSLIILLDLQIGILRSCSRVQ